MKSIHVRFHSGRLLLLGAMFGASFAMAEQLDVSAKSSFQLCVNLKQDSPASPELREASALELARRKQDCKFLDREADPDSPMPDVQEDDSIEEILRRNQDQMNSVPQVR